MCFVSKMCEIHLVPRDNTEWKHHNFFFCTRVTCTWKNFALLHVIWSTGNVQRQTNLLPICRITKRFLRNYASSLLLKYKKKIHSEKGKDKRNHKKRITFRMIILKKKSELKAIKIKKNKIKKKSQTIIYSIYLFKYSKWKQLGQGWKQTQKLLLWQFPFVSHCVEASYLTQQEVTRQHWQCKKTQKHKLKQNFTKSPGRGRI